MVWRSSSDCFCSSCVSAWDCDSSSSVRMFAWIVLMTTPIVSVSWSRNAWLTSPSGRSEPNSITPRTCSSNMIGMTWIVAGVAWPSPEVDLDVVVGHVGQPDRPALDGALADQALAEAEALRGTPGCGE